MHRELRQAHVNAMHAHLSVRQVAQSRAARHIASVGERLHGHACRLAYRKEHGTRNASVQYFWFAALTTMPPPRTGGFSASATSVDSMQSMSVIAAHKHRFRNGAMIIFPREAERGIHALKRIAQHRGQAPCLVFDPTSSLSKQQHTDTSRSFSTAKKRLKRNKGARQIVEFGR